MQFRSNAMPGPTLGADYSKHKKIIVPDQSLSLKQILERFTRGEPVSVGHEASYGEGEDEALDVDLEKLRHADLVDKAEFAQKLKDVQSTYEKQEAKKAKAEKEAAEKAAKEAEEKRIKIAAQKLAKQNLAK